jgi:hypothetical protein
MFDRYAIGAAIPLIVMVGCAELASQQDTADPSLTRYTIEVRGMS